MDAARHDLLRCMDAPREHRAKIHDANPMDRPNCATRRHIEVVGVGPAGGAITHLIGLAAVPQASCSGATNRPPRVPTT